MMTTGFKRLLMLVFLSIFFFVGCSSDDDTAINPKDPDEVYDNGFFVVNEGKFPESGSVSFISRGLDTVQQNIFEKMNGDEVGNTPQSLFFDNQDRAFIIANGSNFITVVDRYTFKKLDRISEEGQFDNPRYGVVSKNKAYITNNPFDGGAFLTIIDLDDFAVIKKIELNEAAEFIYKADNGLIYIQEAAYNEGRQIAVLNPDTDEMEGVIETGKGLNSIAIAGNTLYALSAHKLQKFDLNDHSEVGAVDLDYEDGPARLTIDQGNIYYTAEGKVYEMDIQSTAAPDSPLLDYGSDLGFDSTYGFAVREGRIYLADGGDFTSDSFIYVYELDGGSSTQLKVGIGPNGFYFNW